LSHHLHLTAKLSHEALIKPKRVHGCLKEERSNRIDSKKTVQRHRGDWQHGIPWQRQADA